jgi:hypothetical protein
LVRIASSARRTPRGSKPGLAELVGQAFIGTLRQYQYQTPRTSKNFQIGMALSQIGQGKGRRQSKFVS